MGCIIGGDVNTQIDINTKTQESVPVLCIFAGDAYANAV